MTSGKFATTIGFERQFNPALNIADRDSFVKYMNQDQPLRPANIKNIIAINQGKKPLTMDQPQAPALMPPEVQAMIKDDLMLIDTRSEAEFGAGYIPNAYNIQLSSPEFEQRVGWIMPLEQAMILVLEDPKTLEATLHRLAFLGLDHRVKGYLMGGMLSWLKQGLPIKTLPQLSVHQLYAHLQNGIDMQVLDVRETSEWNEGHIERAHYMNYKVLPGRIDQLALQPDQHISVLCARGLRSSTACSILMRHGYEHVYNITGGMTAWKAAALPVVDSHGCAI